VAEVGGLSVGYLGSVVVESEADGGLGIGRGIEDGQPLERASGPLLAPRYGWREDLSARHTTTTRGERNMSRLGTWTPTTIEERLDRMESLAAIRQLTHR
jgi:hypothetical protein